MVLTWMTNNGGGEADALPELTDPLLAIEDESDDQVDDRHHHNQMSPRPVLKWRSWEMR